MKKNILFFYCLLVVTVVSLKAQEIRSMPADSAYGVVHISVCNMRDEGKFTSGMSTQALLGNAGQGYCNIPAGMRFRLRMTIRDGYTGW